MVLISYIGLVEIRQEKRLNAHLLAHDNCRCTAARFHLGITFGGELPGSASRVRAGKELLQPTKPSGAHLMGVDRPASHSLDEQHLEP
jgi:hypothetical protein